MIREFLWFHYVPVCINRQWEFKEISVKCFNVIYFSVESHLFSLAFTTCHINVDWVCTDFILDVVLSSTWVCSEPLKHNLIDKCMVLVLPLLVLFHMTWILFKCIWHIHLFWPRSFRLICKNIFFLVSHYYSLHCKFHLNESFIICSFFTSCSVKISKYWKFSSTIWVILRSTLKLWDW